MSFLKSAVTTFDTNSKKSHGQSATATLQIQLPTSMATTLDHLKPAISTSSQAKMKSIQLSTSAVTLSIASMHTTRDQSTAVSLQTTWLSSSLLASSNTGGLREPLNQSLIIGASAAVVIAVVIVIASLIIIGAYW